METSPNHDHLGRTGYHGLWSPGSDWGEGCKARLLGHWYIFSSIYKHTRLTSSDIDGDASFSMTLTELSTAAQFNIGVKIIVLNNEEQGNTANLWSQAISKTSMY